MNGVLSTLENPLAGNNCEQHCKYLLSAMYYFALALDLGEEEVDNVMSVVCRIFPKLQKSEAMKFWILAVARMLSVYSNCLAKIFLRVACAVVLLLLTRHLQFFLIHEVSCMKIFLANSVSLSIKIWHLHLSIVHLSASSFSLSC